MVTHFSQKTNVGIALVCMVNHSAIRQHEPNSTNIHTDHSCSQTNNTKTTINIWRSYIYVKLARHVSSMKCQSALDIILYSPIS